MFARLTEDGAERTEPERKPQQSSRAPAFVPHSSTSLCWACEANAVTCPPTAPGPPSNRACTPRLRRLDGIRLGHVIGVGRPARDAAREIAALLR